jgi:hypothetical protein
MFAMMLFCRLMLHSASSLTKYSLDVIPVIRMTQQAPIFDDMLLLVNLLVP